MPGHDQHFTIRELFAATLLIAGLLAVWKLLLPSSIYGIAVILLLTLVLSAVLLDTISERH